MGTLRDAATQITHIGYALVPMHANTSDITGHLQCLLIPDQKKFRRISLNNIPYLIFPATYNCEPRS